MKRQWSLKRELKADPDGQSRWDKAYQLLLSAAAASEATAAGTVTEIPQPQEKSDENRAVRPCLDATPSSGLVSFDRGCIPG